MSDMFVGSQAPLYQNVCITKRSANGKILEQRFAKNRVTRLMLYGIAKFLSGHFNDSTPDKIYEFIPRYLALGSNTPNAGANDTTISTISSVNDTRLLNELKYSSTTGASETIKRLWIAERNMCKINTKFSDPFIKLSIKTYIHSNVYDGLSIGEAGLFSKEKDNNCLARVCFSPIVKNPSEVLDIQWDITLLSYGETKYPEKLEISNGSKVTIPIKYTNKHFKAHRLGLKHYWAYNSIGTELYKDLFTYDSNGNLTTKYTNEDIMNHSGWYEYLTTIGLEDKFDNIIAQLKDSKFDNVDNPYYLISKTQGLPYAYHFGNLYSNQYNTDIPSDELGITLLYSEEKDTKYTNTKYCYVETNEPGTYDILSPNGKKNEYKVVENQFYVKNASNSAIWNETGYFMYNGTIINSKYEDAGYSYDNGYFYKTATVTTDKYVNQYLTYSNSNVDRKYLYSIDSNNSIFNTGYTIDFNDRNKIYLNNVDSTYHLSIDNYWVVSDYLKLTPVLTPTDSTDRTVSWSIQNTDIATINFDGVVTAYNIGETTAITTTSNDLRAKTIIEVVKESKFIDVDKITVNPEEITLIVDGDANQQAIVTATIDPLFATNATVTWNTSYEITNCISLINIGNNQVKLVLNGSGNIGSGHLIATSQSGKSASCLVKVIYKTDAASEDCPDPSHLTQEG